MRFLILCVALLFPMGVYAQTGEAVNADEIIKDPVSVEEQAEENVPEVNYSASALEQSILEAKAENKDNNILSQKIVLARKMHEIRPVRDQVNMAVQRASMQLPEYERQSFENAMRSLLNYNALERISLDAMVETYSLAELGAMVEYYSKPEAVSATLKMPYWAQQVQPEIVRMVDKAIMHIRTGQ